MAVPGCLEQPVPVSQMRCVALVTGVTRVSDTEWTLSEQGVV